MVKKNYIIGLIFIALGILYLLANVYDIEFNIFDLIRTFWPTLFLILPGILMHSAFFSGKNKDAGILVPGGILLVVGITCQISMMFTAWAHTWPGYLLAVAVGLFELYLFGNRDKGLLIPVAILGGLSIVFMNWITFQWLLDVHLRRYIVPGLLVLFGLLIIIRNIPHKCNKCDKTDDIDNLDNSDK